MSDGFPVETDGWNYQPIPENWLEAVQPNSLSKRKATQRLDTSRPTINRALDRAEMHGLDAP